MALSEESPPVPLNQNDVPEHTHRWWPFRAAIHNVDGREFSHLIFHCTFKDCQHVKDSVAYMTSELWHGKPEADGQS